jgi:hypothetical protein
MVDPPASKEAMTYHILSEQVDDRNQYCYEKDSYDSKPRRTFLGSTRSIHVIGHLNCLLSHSTV